MRKSTLFIAVFLLLFGMTAWTVIPGQSRSPDRLTSRVATARLVKTLGLADLSLFTEAAYLRHLSQADRFMAFRDHPLALEHFPGGALIQPPGHLRP